MKKWICFLTAVCMMSFCACGNTSEEEDTISRQELALNTQTEASEAEIAEESSGEAVQTWITDPTEALTEAAVSVKSEENVSESVTEAVRQTQGGSENEPAETKEIPEVQETMPIEDTPVPVITTAAATAPVVYPEETAPAEVVHGAEGRTAEEWIALGQEMYQSAMELSFRYLCSGSAFPFDLENLEIIDRTYFLTTCGSFADATMPYYDVFSREYHGSDFDGILLEQDGRLYAARAARGMDITYLSSEVTELVSVSSEEVVFSVYTEYEDREETGTFTLVPEDGFWKVGEFVLPY